MIVAVVIIVLAVLAGIAIGVSEMRSSTTAGRAAQEDRSGWIYFIGGEEGPIKVGMSAYEPTRQRLPELSTMSPVPLRVHYEAPVDDRFKVEHALHAELAPYREHGEWFDRDAALYFASHIKGEC